MKKSLENRMAAIKKSDESRARSKKTAKVKAPKRAAKVKVSKAPKEPTVLVLRTCKSDLTSTNAFQWPERGRVKAPDWDPTPECGHGLHGWLWGEGDGAGVSAHWEADAKWLVVEVLAKDIVDLSGKVKFPSGTVVLCGDRKGATDYLGARAPGKVIIGGTATAGNWGTASAGNWGTLQIRSWDGQRYRTHTFYVGEDGIEANVAYKLDANNKAVKAAVSK